MNKELESWLVAYDACKPEMDEMKALYITDMQDAYNRASPRFLVWVVTQPGVMSQLQCVEFALFCVRQVEDRLTDERSRAVIPALEHWLAGEITQGEMKAVSDAARAAYSAHIAYAVVHAVTVAAHAAYTATGTTYSTAASAASAAEDAVRAAPHAAYAAVRKDQAQWIREHVPFESLNLGRTK